MQFISNNTQWLLKQWAIWGKDNLGLYYPEFSSFAWSKRKSSSSLIITEVEALKIDSIIARLKHRDKEMGSVLILYHLSQCNLSAVTRTLNIDRRRADVLVKSGIAWVDAILFMENENYALESVT